MLGKPYVHTSDDVFTAQGPWLGRAAGGSGRIGTRLAHGVGGRCQGTHRLGMGWAKAADGQRQVTRRHNGTRERFAAVTFTTASRETGTESEGRKSNDEMDRGLSKGDAERESSTGRGRWSHMNN